MIWRKFDIREFKLGIGWIIGLSAVPSLIILSWSYFFGDTPPEKISVPEKPPQSLRNKKSIAVNPPVNPLAKKQSENRREWARRLAMHYPPKINRAFINRLQDIDVTADIFYEENSRPALEKLDHEIVFCFDRKLQDVEWNNRPSEGSIYGVTYSFTFKNGGGESWEFSPQRLQDIPLGEISQYAGPRCFGISEWFWHPNQKGFEQDINQALDRKFKTGKIHSFTISLLHRTCKPDVAACIEWTKTSVSHFEPFPTLATVVVN